MLSRYGIMGLGCGGGAGVGSKRFAVLLFLDKYGCMGSGLMLFPTQIYCQDGQERGQEIDLNLLSSEYCSARIM